MKPGTIVLIAGAGLAALLYGNAAGLFGGVEGGSGSSKKGTVTTGVSGLLPEPQPVYIPQASQEQFNLLEQFATAMNLSDVKLFPQASGELKYAGIRTSGSTKKEIEGTYRPDLMGQLKIDPDTLQHYYEGDVNPTVVLYTEGSRDIETKKVQQTPSWTPPPSWTPERRAGYTIIKKK